GGSQREYPSQGSLFGVEPWPRAGAGRDQQAVEGNLVAICQAHLLAGSVETGGGHAESPLSIDITHARKQGVVGRNPSLQHLLGEWGTIVRLVLLIPNDG